MTHQEKIVFDNLLELNKADEFGILMFYIVIIDFESVLNVESYMRIRKIFK